MNDWMTIWSLIEQRREHNSPVLSQMIEVRDRYNADWVVPDVSKEVAPDLPPLTPALIAETIDNFGMRAASVLPMVFCPAVNPAKQTGVRSKEYARIRRRIITATYHDSKVQLKLRKAMRHLAGYATTALVVVPDFKRGMPVINVRDPLGAYPDPRAGEDFCEPENIGFVFAKSADWISYNYPQATELLVKGGRATSMWNMVEWIDRDHVVIGLLGPQEPEAISYLYEPASLSMELARWENRIGRVSAVAPQRVTLDRIVSQLAHVIGITDLMAKMMTLDLLAKEKAIFPDRYIIGKVGAQPQIVGGEWQDGRTGIVNVVLDADGIGTMNFAGDPTASQAIDRLERNARISSGLVPQFGGETYGALRTGRGIDALMGAAVDPRIQEMQEVVQAWLPTLNEITLETYKAYWPNKKFTLVSGWPTDSGEVTFTPSEHIETLANAVSYPIAGADVQSTNIILGQLLGSEAISRQTFRERHPWIGDPAEEAARVEEETMERAALQSILNQAMQPPQAGGMSLPQLALIEKSRRSNPAGDIFDAIELAQKRMQEMQAQQAPPAPPGMAAPPETMPGMAPEMAAAPPGADQGATIGANDNLAGLRELMNALSQTSRTV